MFKAVIAKKNNNLISEMSRFVARNANPAWLLKSTLFDPTTYCLNLNGIAQSNTRASFIFRHCRKKKKKKKKKRPDFNAGGN